MDASERAKEEIRARVDLVDYIGAYVRLTRRGQNYIGLCPFHSERTPSFNVSREKRIYKCYGCGEGGDIFSFVMKQENLSFREALERLAERVGIRLEPLRGAGGTPGVNRRERARAVHAEAARYYAGLLWNNPAALEYLRRRGLSDTTIGDFGLGWAPDEWDGLIRHLGAIGWTPRDLLDAGLATSRDGSSYYDRFRGRIMFPIFDVQNRVIAFGGRILGEGEPKYLNSPESPLFNKSRTLYGLNTARHAIAEQDRVLVMEGYMDVLAAHQAGFRYAVATLGTSLTKEHVDVLGRHTRRIVLAYDADSAGVRAAGKAGPVFEQAGMEVRLLVLPVGHDPDSFLREAGPPAFAERIENAVPLVDFQLNALRARHDLETEEGRAEYVRAALPVISSVRSNVTRDRYIRRLAEEWARDDLARVMYREEDIRRDMTALARRAFWEARNRQAQAAQREAAAAPLEGPEPVEPARPAVPSGLDKAETEVLRALLREPALVQPLHLQTWEFADGPRRRIAERVMARLASGEGSDLLEEIGDLPEEEARIVTDLHIAEEPPLSAAAVEDSVERLRAHARQRRLQELKAYITEHVEPLIRQGIAPRDDPRWQEWLELQQQARVSDRTRVR